MLHARKDYDAIQDPREGPGRIADDEPVFILRAKDVNAPQVVRYWAARAEGSGADRDMIMAVERHADRMEEWQEKNGSKVPDTPREMLR